MIKKESNGYHIYSHNGKKHLGGPYTKEHAEKRLKQIEYFKNIKEDTEMNKDEIEFEGYEEGSCIDGKKKNCPYNKTTDPKKYNYWMVGFTNGREDIETTFGRGMYKEDIYASKKVNIGTKCPSCKSKDIEKIQRGGGVISGRCKQCGDEWDAIKNESLDESEVRKAVRQAIDKNPDKPSFTGCVNKFGKDEVFKILKQEYGSEKTAKRLLGEDMELDEAKSPEELKLFNKFEKQCANALDLTLPLPKDTPRATRNKLYAMVATKMKKSNVSKVMEALMEGTVKYNLSPLELKQLKKVAQKTNLSFHALASRPETARNMINRVLGEDVEELNEEFKIKIEDNKYITFRDRTEALKRLKELENEKDPLPSQKKQIQAIRKAINESLNEATVTIEKSRDGEYRVPAEDGYEDGAAYTDDKEDAIGIAKTVYGKDVEIKFKSVFEFVGGKYEKYRPKAKKK